MSSHDEDRFWPAVLVESADRMDSLDRALRDAISTYDHNKSETFVSKERQEAWLDALGDPNN